MTVLNKQIISDADAIVLAALQRGTNTAWLVSACISAKFLHDRPDGVTEDQVFGVFREHVTKLVRIMEREKVDCLGYPLAA